MEPVADGIHLVDILHQGRPSVIATGVVRLASGVALVDPGPASALPTLRAELERAGIPFTDVRALLLTHIHLDHAGASGTIARELPDIDVYVHERGAHHMEDPRKLVYSATRLFGDDMDRLWGECAPVPADRLRPLAGGETLALGGATLEVAYTPGHASHHVAYLHAASGVAFVGDAAGGRIRAGPLVLPATPPPDIDVDTIIASFARIAAWHPEQLFITHCGPIGDVAEHGDQLEARLRTWAQRVARDLDSPGSDEDLAAAFAAEISAELRASLDEETAVAYERGAPVVLSWLGLARYWRTRE